MEELAKSQNLNRDGSRTSPIYEIELFVTIFDGFQPLTNATKIPSK